MSNRIVVVTLSEAQGLEAVLEEAFIAAGMLPQKPAARDDGMKAFAEMMNERAANCKSCRKDCGFRMDDCDEALVDRDGVKADLLHYEREIEKLKLQILTELSAEPDNIDGAARLMLDLVSCHAAWNTLDGIDQARMVKKEGG